MSSRRVFGLFQQLHGRSEFLGTGAGLAICKKVADNHGGYLATQSQLGRGSGFSIYLPLE